MKAPNSVLPKKTPKHSQSSSTLVNTQNIEYVKPEAQAMTELDLHARRYFIAFLFNIKIDESVRAVFPDMVRTHKRYTNAKLKIRNLYKN